MSIKKSNKKVHWDIKTKAGFYTACGCTPYPGMMTIPSENLTKLKAVNCKPCLKIRNSLNTQKLKLFKDAIVKLVRP